MAVSSTERPATRAAERPCPEHSVMVAPDLAVVNPTKDDEPLLRHPRLLARHRSLRDTSYSMGSRDSTADRMAASTPRNWDAPPAS